MIWKGTPVNPGVTLPWNVASFVDHSRLGKRLKFQTLTLDINHRNSCSLLNADSSFGRRLCSRVSRGYIVDVHCRIWEIDVVVSRRRVTRCCWYRCPCTYSGVVADAKDQDKVAKLLRAILKFGVSVRTWGPWVLYSGQTGGMFSSHRFLTFASTKAEELQNVTDNDLVACVQVDENKRGTIIEGGKLHPDQISLKNQSEIVDSLANTLGPWENMITDGSWLEMQDKVDTISYEVRDSKFVHCKDAGRCQLDRNKSESPIADTKWGSEQSFPNYLEITDQLESAASPAAIKILQQFPRAIDKESLPEKCDNNNRRLSDTDNALISNSDSTRVAGDFDNVIQSIVCHTKANGKKPESLIDAKLGSSYSSSGNWERNGQSEAVNQPVVVNCSKQQPNMVNEVCWCTKLDQNDMSLSDPDDPSLLERRSSEEGAFESDCYNGDAAQLIGDENKRGSVVLGAIVGPNKSFSNNLGRNDQLEILSSQIDLDTAQQLPNMMDDECLLNTCDEDTSVSEADRQTFLKSKSMVVGGLLSAVPNGGATHSQEDEIMMGPLVEEARLCPEQSLLNNALSDEHRATVSSLVVADTLQQMATLTQINSCLRKPDEICSRLHDANDLSLLKSVLGGHAETCAQADQINLGSTIEDGKLGSEQSNLSNPDNQSDAASLPVVANTLKELQSVTDEDGCLKTCTDISERISNVDNKSSLKNESFSNAAVILFDIETTGFKISDDRIVEFAARDLAGGECSTLQTLVNPERSIPIRATNIHGIGTEMVNRSDIPRWKDVAPILMQFVETRRHSGDPVILIAHNGRKFDVPFLLKEFERCLLQIPTWWHFVDTMPLAREAMKATGLKGLPLNLSALHEHYDLPFSGHAHRALADVSMLASVLQRIMIDLKMPVSALIEKAFTAEDVMKSSSLSSEDSMQLPNFIDNLESNPQEIECDHASLSEDEFFIENACISTTVEDENFVVPWEYEQTEGMVSSQDLKDKARATASTDSCLEANRNGFAVSPRHQLNNEKKHISSGEQDELFLLPTHQMNDELSISGVTDFCFEVNGMELANNSTHQEDTNQMDLETALNKKVHDPTLRTDNVDKSQLTPMLKEYVQTKLQRPNLLLLWRVGDFYEAFFEDAEKLVDMCNVGLAAVEVGELGDIKVPMASFHYAEGDHHIQTLLRKGVGVIKQEQAKEKMRDEKLPLQTGTLIFTPGTTLDDGRFLSHFDNQLVAVIPPSDEHLTWGLAYCDISTGECYATQDQGRKSLVEEILRLRPSEIIYPADAICTTNSETGQIRPCGLPSQFYYSRRPASDFHLPSAMKMLEKYIGLDASEQFELESIPLGTNAAGGLLGYIVETQNVLGADLPLCKISPYLIDDYMRMDYSARTHLEVFVTAEDGRVEGSLLWAMDQTKTAIGKRMLRKWLLRPLVDKDEILARLDAVEVFVNEPELRAQVRHDLSFMNDLGRLAGRIAWNQGTSWDLLALGHSINILPPLLSGLEKTVQNPYFSALGCCKTLFELGQKIQTMLAVKSWTVIQDGSYIKDGADESLDMLRGQIKLIDIWLKNYQKSEQERLRFPSLEIVANQMGQHFIIIQKDELKDEIIPIDYQSYSETREDAYSFITASLMENNKRREEAVVKARLREAEILRNLRQEVLSILDKIQQTSQAVASIDILSSFAEVSALRGYCKPIILEGSQEITVVSGRHPMAEMSVQGNSQYVPNSVYMGYQSQKEKSFLKAGGCLKLKGTDVLQHEEVFEPVNEHCKLEGEELWPRPDLIILTGPPGSGKSCYLKQIGLIQLLAQTGSFVPAREAKLGIADAIYMNMGLHANVSARQSCCKLEMVDAANILDGATSQSLVLLDGIGRNMLSQEGSAISRAMIEFLAQYVTARTLVSTHHDSLQHLERAFSNISNYCFGHAEIEDDCITYHHKIMPGFCIQSCALAIGKSAGLPEWVCSRAAELISSNRRTSDEKFQMELVHEKENSIKEKNSQSVLHLKDPVNIFGQIDFAGSSRRKNDGSVIRWPSASPSLEDAAVGKSELSQDTQSPESAGKKLNDIWQEVCKVLQNQPATYALAKQKGSLLSIDESPEVSNVRISASALFVKKFQQYEHATALECAFTTILQRPVQLKVTVAFGSGKHR